jgi:Ni/Co efflux regulator RcnB
MKELQMKTSFKYGLLALVMSAGLIGSALPAHAEDHGWHNGGPKYQSHHDNRYDNSSHYYGRGTHYQTQYRRPVVVIQNHDRVVLRDYVHRNWRPLRVNYAPRYFVGAPLPRYVTYYPVPNDVLVQLQPVPYGYRYVRVDDDILLLDATANVIDAIAQLSR